MQTKDSGQRQQFGTGAQRDTDEGKPRWENVPFKVMNEMQQRFGGAPVHLDTEHPLQVDADPEQRHDLIPQLMLDRLAALYYRGAMKYDDNNWQKGIPLRRVFGSLLRHAWLWFWGDRSEDHLAAVIWNATTLMWTEWAIDDGIRTSVLDDRPKPMTRVYYGEFGVTHITGWRPKESLENTFGADLKGFEYYVSE